MLKSYRNSAAAMALIVAASAFLAMPSQRISAQSDGPAVFAVDLDITPAELDKYLAAIRENGAATIKEPGCREYNIMVSATTPNHVFIFEVYKNDAAAQAPRVLRKCRETDAAAAVNFMRKHRPNDPVTTVAHLRGHGVTRRLLRIATCEITVRRRGRLIPDDTILTLDRRMVLTEYSGPERVGA